MTDKKLIHVKLEYNEAVQSNKDILQAQASLIKIIKTMKQYSALRANELSFKLKLHRKIKETLTGIRKLERELPKTQKLHLEKEAQEEPILELPKKVSHDANLEMQLQEIQDRLKNLQ